MKAQRLLSSTVFLAGANTLNSLLALVGRQLVAFFFGSGFLADAFFLAQAVPRELMWWFRRAIKAAAIPVYSERLVQDGSASAWDTVRAFSSLATLAAGVLMVAYWAAAPWLVPLLAPGFDARHVDTLVELTRLLSPIMVLTVAYALAESALNAHKHFTSPGLSQLAVPISLIAATWFGAPRFGILAPLTGLVVGFTFQIGLLLPLFRHAARALVPTTHVLTPHSRAIVGQLLPIVFGYTLGNLNPLIARALGTQLGLGRVAALSFAWSVVNVMPLVLVNSLGTTLFPSLSESVAREDREGLARISVTYLRAAVYLFLPAALSVMVLGEPIVRLLFQRGEFDATATTLTSAALLGYAPCILTSPVMMFFQQLFFARKRSVVVMQTVLLGLVTNVVAMLLLMRWLDVLGLALAYSLMALVQIVFLLVRLRREMGELPLGRLGTPLLRVALGAALMGAAELAALGWLEASFGVDGLLAHAAVVGSGLALGSAVYLGATWALGLTEPRRLAGLGGRAVRRLRRRPPA